MFAADHQRAADEMVRVTRPGGRIAVASWTPQGFVGAMLATVGRHVAPPAGAQRPTLWGKSRSSRICSGTQWSTSSPSPTG